MLTPITITSVNIKFFGVKHYKFNLYILNGYTIIIFNDIEVKTNLFVLDIIYIGTYYICCHFMKMS